MPAALAKQQVDQAADEASDLLQRTEPDWGAITLSKMPKDAIYQRMIIIVPYKSSEKVKQIETSFEQINI